MNTQTARVLVVDDEKSLRISLREFLKVERHSVEVAEDAPQALRLLEEQSFDIIVSDIVLPGMNGIDLLEAIRAAAPDAQVIMMTGDPTVATAAAALRAGAFDYLTKPVSKNAILRTVQNAARLKASADETRRLATENKRYREELERLIDERTVELRKAIEELQNAQGEIIRHERLNALAQLAAGICHDFNNVLMPIRGLAEHMVTHPDVLDDKEKAMELLGHIHSAANDAREIVRRMREFYRPQDIMESGCVDVAQLFEDVTELTRPKWESGAQTQGTTVLMECRAEQTPPIAGNMAQLREALTNLVLNAVDAMPNGGTVGLSAEFADGEIVLRVHDTGEGMPEEIRRRCLEPFFTTKGDKGTGMGLAMVHGIVARHSGSLDIESVSGKGTTFVLHLPQWSVDGPEIKATHTSTGNVGKLSVLVIDDEQWSRTLIGKYLSEAEHSVEYAENGEDGVRKASEQRFDLVITDRAMPGLSGEMVAQKVKALYPEIPVLMLTGDIINRAGETPPCIDRVVEKPVTQRELLEAVQLLCGLAVT